MEISCQRFRIFLSYRYSRPNDLNWSCAWFLSGGVTVSSAIGVRQIALDRDYGNCPSSNLRPQVEGAHSRCTQHKHRCTKIICLHTDTSAHKHRCKHRCTQWGLEWLWKQESVGRSWGVTVRSPCTLYIVHTVQPILFKYLPSVRQNTTTSRIKDVHWLLLSGSPTDMHLDVRSRWVGKPDYDFVPNFGWWGVNGWDKSLTSLYGRTGKIKTPEHFNIESNWLKMWYRVLD